MGNNFYQLNNEILKLDPYNDKDIEYIKFNNYLCRKENLQRTKGDLTRGLFKLSYTTISDDTGLPRVKSHRIMKWFMDKGIIELIKKATVKGESSIYAYTSVYYAENDIKSGTDFGTDFGTNIGTDLSSNFNTFNYATGTDTGTNIGTDFGISKKEKEKENIKNSTASTVSFTDLINSYTNNSELVEALFGFIDMRNEMNEIDKKNKILTVSAFKSILKKLDEYGKNDKDKIFILNDAIFNNSLMIQSIDEINKIKKATTRKVEANKNNLETSNVYVNTPKVEVTRFI